MLAEQPLASFLAALASKATVPAGASAAALAGAASAALLAALCRSALASCESDDAPTLRATVEQTDRLRVELLALAHADILAFRALTAAFQLPDTDLEHRARRHAQIQGRLIDATEVPVRIGELSAQIVELITAVVRPHEAAGLVEAGVGLTLAHAALDAAWLTSRVNLRGISEPLARKAFDDRVRALGLGSALAAEALRQMRGR